ncbi:hypothetical protein GCM10027406_31590 [Leifsonia lichenia]
MLRGVVENFLDSLTEREFDAPLLALLSAQGFTDIHFIHGAFEFGKDVIAKRRDSVTGGQKQYAIQSKAGDIGQSSWREIRPQLEEAEYNTRAHPNYDASLPRVAVLLTTGRLKGAAAVDAQEYKASAKSRGVAEFEIWDRKTLADWMSDDPSTGLLGSPTSTALMTLVAAIESGEMDEPRLERFTRTWIEGDGTVSTRAAIESAVVVNSLRRGKRLDLAAFVALHLVRASVAHTSETPNRSGIYYAALRLFAGIAAEVLDEIEPLLPDPSAFARATFRPMAIVAYQVVCCRTAELIALLAISTEDELLAERAANAAHLLAKHPGAARPVSDQFAVSLLPVAMVLGAKNPAAAITYVRSIAIWLLDRYDPDKAGLGLASIGEPELVAVERLLGGAFDVTETTRRPSSYLVSVVMDLCILLGARDLYDVMLDNLTALRITPEMEAANENKAHWRRGGDGVHPHPVVTYQAWGSPLPPHHQWTVDATACDAMLLTASCRSRHYPSILRAWLANPPPVLGATTSA